MFVDTALPAKEFTGIFRVCWTDYWECQDLFSRQMVSASNRSYMPIADPNYWRTEQMGTMIFIIPSFQVQGLWTGMIIILALVRFINGHNTVNTGLYESFSKPYLGIQMGEVQLQLQLTPCKNFSVFWAKFTVVCGFFTWNGLIWAKFTVVCTFWLVFSHTTVNFAHNMQFFLQGPHQTTSSPWWPQ